MTSSLLQLLPHNKLTDTGKNVVFFLKTCFLPTASSWVVRVEFPAKAYPSQIAMMDKVRIAVVLSDSYLISRKLLPHVQQRRLEGETVMIELTRTHGPLSKYHRHPSFYYINTQSSAAVLDMTGGRGIISCRNLFIRDD